METKTLPGHHASFFFLLLRSNGDHHKLTSLSHNRLLLLKWTKYSYSRYMALHIW